MFFSDPVQRMLNDIRAHARDSQLSTGRGELDPRVLAAMGRVPRERFVPEYSRAQAHADRPLPIGEGQTISQPFIVALMTDLVQPGSDGRILEIGTGCGYQTALLAELAAQVYSIEIVPELAQRAAQLLEQLGYTNLHLRIGDGNAGWPEQAPFDGILVTAAAPRLPPCLVEQLAPGGRLVVPVGPPWRVQSLMLVEKDAAGQVRGRDLLAVAFVPMTGRCLDPDDGWS